MIKTSNNYPFYDMSYNDTFPVDQYFLELFNNIPSRLINRNYYSPEIIDYFMSNGFSVVAKESKLKKNSYDYTNSIFLVNKGMKSIITTGSHLLKEETGVEFVLLYDATTHKQEDVIDLKKIEKYLLSTKKSSVEIVKSTIGGMETESFDLVVPEINLGMNYGESFMKVHDVIMKRLNQPNDKGIVLLHGEPGTGKTTYLKYLTKCIEDKSILFIPPSMAEVLSDPQIIPFLIENKNSILLIEDAERVISDREGNGSSAGVSNLLNLTDGILGDCLNIQVIATFNMKREKIDNALLRKGRLICEHKFDKLTVDDTNKLLTHLNKGVKSNIPMTLADIYNIDEEEIKVSSEKKSIGFK